ncbi:MAG: LysR substrate-binding domain-containing protein [Acetobacteraceae bacterium]
MARRHARPVGSAAAPSEPASPPEASPGGLAAGAARLPPLNLFRTFHEAARHRSFRDAAALLCITPSAVSQQIQRLEDLLGVKLFRRLPRRIELTRQGASLATAAGEAIAMLQAACEQIAIQDSMLRVDVAPGLGSSWLVSRLPGFRAEHPDVTIMLQASNEPVDFTRQDVDLAIRWGDGRWPGVQATRLAHDAVFPVCSPGFRERHGLHGLKDLPALRQVTQLHVTAQGNTWSDWLATAGHGSIVFRDVQHFSDATLMLKAAMHGHGICLASYLLVEQELRSKQLVRPFDLDLELSEGYFVLTNPRRGDQPAIGWFRDWLCKQAGQSLTRRSQSRHRDRGETARTSRRSAAA